MPAEGTRDDELARLLELGARTVEDLRNLGKEFCSLRSEAERAGG